MQVKGSATFGLQTQMIKLLFSIGSLRDKSEQLYKLEALLLTDFPQAITFWQEGVYIKSFVFQMPFFCCYYNASGYTAYLGASQRE